METSDHDSMHSEYVSSWLLSLTPHALLTYQPWPHLPEAMGTEAHPANPAILAGPG